MDTSGDAKHPFCLEDAEIKIGHQHIFDVHLATVAQLLSATFSSLTFTTQKNGVKGEKLSHATNGQPFACPVHAITCHIIPLNHHHAPPSTSLHIYYDKNDKRRAVSSSMITSLLRAAVISVTLPTANIAAWSLRASGAMALLLGSLDPDKI